jgi:hypothetical protein
MGANRPSGADHVENTPLALPEGTVFHLTCLSDQINPKILECFNDRIAEYLPRLKNRVVTIIDYSLPSTSKRLWTVNLDTDEVIFHTWVAHGRNTGENTALHFSNTAESYQSSLGFYLTENTYTGKHGNSLRLLGLEEGINDLAMERAIVIHGAEYVSEAFIKAHGRLGRSHGCPAVPVELADDFIASVKEGSLMFLYHPSYAVQ